MELIDALRGRRTVRNFKSTPIQRSLIRNIVEMGICAPNAGNKQTWRFIAVDDKEILMEMKRIVDRITLMVTGEEILPEKRTFQNLFFSAPTTIICLMEEYRSRTDTYLEGNFPDRYFLRTHRVNPSLQSVSAAITQMLLAAHQFGVGSCWMTGPLIARPELSDFLGIRAPEEIAAFIALGYPEKIPSMPPRKSVDDILTFFAG
jgi:nitroreductase